LAINKILVIKLSIKVPSARKHYKVDTMTYI